MRHRIGQTCLQGLLHKQGDIFRRTVRHVKMASPRIAEKRNATLGVHHTECQCRIHPSLPPFIFPFYHQAGNTVDVTRPSPLQILSSVTGQVRTRRIPMVRYHGQGALRMPGRKIPRVGRHGGMPYRDDGSKFQLTISAGLRQIVQHLPISFRASRIRFPLLVPSGGNPDQCHTSLFHLAAEQLVLKQSLLTHVVRAYHHGPDLHAVLRNPQEGLRMPSSLGCDDFGNRNGPLPLSGPPLYEK